MSDKAKLIAGIILITIPTIQYGGYFLLRLLSGKIKLPLTDFQKSMFRAGHAHAGVLVILAIIAQLLIDHVSASPFMEEFLRLGFPGAAILVSGGFFASASGKERTRPNSLIWILCVGVFLLAFVSIYLGVSLVVSRNGY
jgi:hypothetical protein